MPLTMLTMKKEFHGFLFSMLTCVSLSIGCGPLGRPSGRLSSAATVVIHLFYKSSESRIFFVIGAKDTESQMPQSCPWGGQIPSACTPCIRLARGKFDLTNQYSAGRKNFSVLTSS